jgi:hypothetical protein
MAVYLNTYRIWQSYGGPEEGGWWYESGEPVQSVLISDMDIDDWYETICGTPEDRQQQCANATLFFTQGKAPVPAKTGHGGYTFMPGSDEPVSFVQDNDYQSCFEDHFAEVYPQERPRYQ